MGVKSAMHRMRGVPLFYLFVALFPILPSYTCFMNYPVYTLISILICGVIILLNQRRAKYISRFFFVGAAIISAMYAVPFIANVQPERIFVELVNMFVPLFLIWFVLKNDRSASETSISIILTVSLLLGLFGFVEAISGFNVFSLIENRVHDNFNFGSTPATRWGMIRIEQSFNTALSYGLYQAMCFGLAFYRFMTRRGSMVKYLVLMLIQVVNIILTWTRGVTFVFIVGIAGMIFLNRREFGLKKIFNTFLALVLVVCILMINDSSYLELAGRLFGAGVSILFTGTGGVYDDASIGMRANYQRAAYEALKDPWNVLFGVGEYRLRDMVSIDNEYLLELTAYGIFGFAAFAVLLLIPVFICMKGARIARRKGDVESLMFYRVMLMTHLVYVMSMCTVAQMAEARMYYLIWGITVCARYHRNISGVKKCTLR